jgi:hypothetical protein
VPPLSSSNNPLHSCRLSIAEKHGANNQQAQSKAPLAIWQSIDIYKLYIDEEK